MQGEVYLVKEGGCTGTKGMPAFPSTSILSSSHVLRMQLLKEGLTIVCSLRLCSKIIISIFWSEDAVLGSGHLFLNWLLINIINYRKVFTYRLFTVPRLFFHQIVGIKHLLLRTAILVSDVLSLAWEGISNQLRGGGWFGRR